MKQSGFGANDVKQVYTGAEKDLWELVMGEQIHVGGMMSSMDLATTAGLKEGMHGIDLCCCTGAGCRFLAKNFKTKMTGLDMTDRVYGEALDRTKNENLDNMVNFAKGDVTAIPFPNDTFDFVWGEDAWCYVENKDKLISEASRVLKKGGIISFTDWVEGNKGLTDEEALRLNTFMKFPYMESVAGYKSLMEKHGFEVKDATEQEGYMSDHIGLYLGMLTKQLTYDALKIIGDDMALFQAMGGEMMYMKELADKGKFARGRFVGVKK